MSEIQVAGEIAIDMDGICADLNAQLDDVSAEGGTSTDLDVSNTVSPLESPRLDLYDNRTLSSPDSLALFNFTAFATRCADKPATTYLGHYLDRIAFATTVMHGTALTASSQQLRSADGIFLEPSLLSEAQSQDNWIKWKEAMIVEMTGMQKMDVFELVDLPTDGKLIGVWWVYKLKLDTQRHTTQYKARLVAQGYAQRPGLDYDQTFNPVICLQTIQILLALAHRYRLHVAQLNVSTAFLNGKIDKVIHIRIPPTFESHENSGKCYCLKKALYGLKQVGCLWHTALDKQLRAFGFK